MRKEEPASSSLLLCGVLLAAKAGAKCQLHHALKRVRTGNENISKRWNSNASFGFWRVQNP
jgi:hypothetical protein